MHRIKATALRLGRTTGKKLTKYTEKTEIKNATKLWMADNNGEIGRGKNDLKIRKWSSKSFPLFLRPNYVCDDKRMKSPSD